MVFGIKDLNNIDNFFKQVEKQATKEKMVKKKLVVFKGRKVNDFVVKSAKNTLDYEIGEHIAKVDLVHLIELEYEVDLVGRPK